MSSQLEPIDPHALIDITGGNGQTEKGNVGVTVPTPNGNVQVGIQGERTRTNYAKCVDAVLSSPNVTPQAIRETCGMPPS